MSPGHQQSGQRKVNRDSSVGRSLFGRAKTIGEKISFDPQTISQGDTVSFSIRSMDSNFLENPPTVTFYESFVESNDIQLRDLNIINERKISGQIQISNAATIGHRAIEIESGNEKKHLPYAFEILERPWDPKDVAIDLQMSVERYLDPTTCDLFEEVVCRPEALLWNEEHK